MSCVVYDFIYMHWHKKLFDVILLSIFSFPRNDEIDLHNIIMSLYVITNFFGVCFRVYVFV